MTYTSYTTKEGERLDTIAHNLYADSANWQPILDANPTLSIQPNYPAGLVLRVPVLDSADTSVGVSALPPWKR